MRYLYEAYLVDGVEGVFTLTEHERMEWVDPGELDGYNIYPDFRECLRALTGV